MCLREGRTSWSRRLAASRAPRPKRRLPNLAKGTSEDPATAKNGGRVAGFVKKNPNKPDDPYQKTLEMKPGEVTDPIKYKNAYYILRRGEAVPKTFRNGET